MENILQSQGKERWFLEKLPKFAMEIFGSRQRPTIQRNSRDQIELIFELHVDIPFLGFPRLIKNIEHIFEMMKN